MARFVALEPRANQGARTNPAITVLQPDRKSGLKGAATAPDDEILAWALRGRLGRNAERRYRDEEVAGYGNLMVQIELVAGARNHLTLEFAWAAA